MGHPLINRPPKKNTQEQVATKQALDQNQYEASIFVGRRKVWATRAKTRQEAFAQAEAQETQYSGANPEIKVKRIKASD
jgi:hypothetical protein